MEHWQPHGDITVTVRNYAQLAGKRNVVTQKTGINGGKVSEFPDVQQLIQNYGMIVEWSGTRGARFSRVGHSSYLIKVALLYPMNRPLPAENREVRTELYLQAESIIEILKREKFQIINPPRILLGGAGEQIEGSMEVEFQV